MKMIRKIEICTAELWGQCIRLLAHSKEEIDTTKGGGRWKEVAAKIHHAAELVEQKIARDAEQGQDA